MDSQHKQSNRYRGMSPVEFKTRIAELAAEAGLVVEAIAEKIPKAVPVIRVDPYAGERVHRVTVGVSMSTSEPEDSTVNGPLNESHASAKLLLDKTGGQLQAGFVSLARVVAQLKNN